MGMKQLFKKKSKQEPVKLDATVKPTTSDGECNCRNAEECMANLDKEYDAELKRQKEQNEKTN